MHTVGKINRDIYKCITEDIVTDEVIITDERIQHIEQNHPEDYKRFGKYIPSIISEPDYLIRDDRPNTAMVLKSIFEHDTGEYFRLALRLVTSSEDPSYKNSVITFMHIRKGEYKRVVKNKEVIYKKE